MYCVTRLHHTILFIVIEGKKSKYIFLNILHKKLTMTPTHTIKTI